MVHHRYIHKLIFVLVIASCCFCVLNKPGQTEDDVLSFLQGEWEIINAENNGEEIPKDQYKSTYLIFQGNLLIPSNNPDDPAEIKLNPEKKPAWIDLTPRNEETMLGIYRIDGSRCKICMSDEGSPRPVTFKTSPDTDTYMMELSKKL